MNLLDAEFEIKGEARDVLRHLAGDRAAQVTTEIRLTTAVHTRGIGRQHGFRDPYDLPAIINGDANSALATVESLVRQTRLEVEEENEIKNIIAQFVHFSR